MIYKANLSWQTHAVFLTINDVVIVYTRLGKLYNKLDYLMFILDSYDL